MPDNLFNPDKLQSKIGKLPIWAWGIIGGTVVLGGYYFTTARKRARTADAGVNASNDNLASVFTGMATPDQTNLATLPVEGYNGATITNGDNALGDTTLENNLTWLNKGSRVAQAKGFTAAGSVSALQKYLGGKPLNDNEVKIVNAALQANGYPPEGAPLLTKVVMDATPTPVQTKDKTKTVTPAKTVTKTVTPTVETKTGSNGYPLDAKGREVIEYSSLDPVYAQRILSGKFAGQKRPLVTTQKDKIYIPVAKTYVPSTPTN